MRVRLPCGAEANVSSNVSEATLNALNEMMIAAKQSFEEGEVKVINDEFTNANISRQRRYQLRRSARGLCQTCGRPAMPCFIRCEQCHKKVLKANRRHQGPKRYANTKYTRRKNEA